MSILRKKVKSLSCVQLFATPMNYTRLLSPWKLSRQEYWSGLAFPPPGDLPNPGMEPRSPTLQADALSSEPPGKPTSKIWWQRDSGFHYLCLLLLAVSEGRQLLCCELDSGKIHLMRNWGRPSSRQEAEACQQACVWAQKWIFSHLSHQMRPRSWLTHWVQTCERFLFTDSVR